MGIKISYFSEAGDLFELLLIFWIPMTYPIGYLAYYPEKMKDVVSVLVETHWFGLSLIVILAILYLYLTFLVIGVSIYKIKNI